MQIMKVDPRSLKDNPDRTRQTKSSPQDDALLLATIKAVGVVQPPIIFPEGDGGNGYVIESGHRRTRLAIAAGLEEIDVLVVEAANDNGAMRAMVENTARETLNPVDLWRGIERLVALDWTEEAIAAALALPVRQIRKLRLIANVLPAMLDQMALGDMPSEQQLRIIAAASIEEQKQVWKANKPKKGERAQWWSMANALNKTRMYARDASFGDDLAAAYGIEWAEDLFAPADQDCRFTTNVEAFLGAQQEWMTDNLPKRGTIVDVNSWGEPELPKKAERVYGKSQKGDHTAMYLDREGKVQSVVYRLPEVKKPTARTGSVTGAESPAHDDQIVVSKPRPDVTQNGYHMIGDFRTDALHEALGRAPIEDDMLIALLILAFAGMNVRVDSGAGGVSYDNRRFKRHAAMLFDGEGKFSFDMDTVRVAARSTLVDVLSCRRNASNSGVVSRIAGEAIGADAFLPNMGTVDFLECLSRTALEASCSGTSVLPRPRVRDTRAALVEHFKDGHFVHPAALFAPDLQDLVSFLAARDETEESEEEDTSDDTGALEHHEQSEGEPAIAENDDNAACLDEEETAYGIAAE